MKVGDKVRVTVGADDLRWHSFEVGEIVTCSGDQFAIGDYAFMNDAGHEQYLLPHQYEPILTNTIPHPHPPAYV